MKILEVTNVDFSLYQFLLPTMRALKKQGHEVMGACASGDLLRSVRQEGFEVFELPFIRSYSIKGQWKAFCALYHLIKREKPDIVHAHMPISGFLARVAAFLCGTPIIIYTCHGFLFNQPGTGLKSYCRRLLSFFLEWSAGRITHTYMTVSKEEAKDARKLKIHQHPVYIGNGRNPDLFYPDVNYKKQFRQQENVKLDKVVFLIVSRLVRHKGYPELLTAFTEIAKKNSNAELWIVGERLPSDHGNSLDDLFTKAQHDLGDQIRFWGYREDIAQLMQAADIFVLPSLFEGLPMSVIEAMLSGLPVISTNIRGPREQVQHYKTGILVPPGQPKPLAAAIAWMMVSPEQRKKMGESGRQYAVAHFTEEQQLERILTVFERLNSKANH